MCLLSLILTKDMWRSPGSCWACKQNCDPNVFHSTAKTVNDGIHSIITKPVTDFIIKGGGNWALASEGTFEVRAGTHNQHHLGALLTFTIIAGCIRKLYSRRLTCVSVFQVSKLLSSTNRVLLHGWKYSIALSWCVISHLVRLPFRLKLVHIARVRTLQSIMRLDIVRLELYISKNDIISLNPHSHPIWCNTNSWTMKESGR